MEVRMVRPSACVSKTSETGLSACCYVYTTYINFVCDTL